MSTASASPVFNLAEPIPGYRLQERIGAGGYGEVWKAEAPGGIAKAIKVVYGHHDDERAARELAALNRIKEVRHPFLLSLERIELIDGHLVIVAELASSSLKNEFDLCRESGLPGIPRDELLAHLQDAADALDHLGLEHSLQHLDVKPENLLLVGGRIKVADFGLVKDLQDIRSSIISGLTPVYAAPELFDGRPSSHSDQYSLAIVYQEMLTGTVPYEGRTTAQLAAQHLHSRPRLDHLPASDQATIAKALSKDPQQRFASCREMIDNLLEAAPTRRARQARPAAAPRAPVGPPRPTTDTEKISWDALPLKTGDAPRVSSGAPLAEPAPAERELPPLELRAEDLVYGPVIFVGIGGLAARTLQALRGRLVDRFGDIHALPALQLLLFDTDADTLRLVTEGGRPTSLDDNSVVLLPLRQAADYRRESSCHLQWLSRRWLYNIPRSCQTQGLRPLGRLALVDHIDRVTNRLTQAVQAATDPEALAASARQTGLPLRPAPPRIFVIASTSGGTGSGMALDVGYLARKVLRDLSFPEDGVCGILAHCTRRQPQTRDLAIANTYSFLTELHHFSDPNYGYPGDPACGLPAFDPRQAPFQHAYVVHLGEELDQDDFARAVDQLARYLYCDVVTPASAFFAKCRAIGQPSDAPDGALPSARTLGLCQVGLSDSEVPAAAIHELCRALVTRWRGVVPQRPEDCAASLSDPASLVASQRTADLPQGALRGDVTVMAQEAGLELGRLLEQLHAAAAREMGNDPESYLLSFLTRYVDDASTGAGFWKRLPPAQAILDTLDALIRSREAASSSRVCLESALERHLPEIAAGKAAALCNCILGLVASPEHRVQGAQQASDLVAGYLRAVAHDASEQMQTSLRHLRNLRDVLLKGRKGGRLLRFRGLGSRRRLVLDPQLSQYFLLKIDELALNAVCRLTGLILAGVANLDERLRNLSADLNRLAEAFPEPRPEADSRRSGTDHVESGHRATAEAIRQHKAELVAEMEGASEEDLARAVAAPDEDICTMLCPALRRTARATILRMFRRVTLEEVAATCAGEPRPPIFSLPAALETARPKLSGCGGARRLLVLAPDALPPELLLQQFDEVTREPPTIVVNPEQDVLVCCEVEQLLLRHVAAAVLAQRGQHAEVASRLHTRIDVPWLPL